MTNLNSVYLEGCLLDCSRKCKLQSWGTVFSVYLIVNYQILCPASAAAGSLVNPASWEYPQGGRIPCWYKDSIASHLLLASLNPLSQGTYQGHDYGEGGMAEVLMLGGNSQQMEQPSSCSHWHQGLNQPHQLQHAESPEVECNHIRPHSPELC